MRRRGLTLIELTVVLALLAIFAVGAGMSLKSPYQTARFENAVERIVALDRRAREHARRFRRPAELLINDKSLRVVDPRSRSVTQELKDVARDARIDRVALRDRLIDYGTTGITINGSGGSPTYALRLRGPAEQTVWLLFAGLSGQATRIENDDEIEQILQLMAAEGADAP